MARKPKHEDHQNHEAWAVPYGDLVTLLLAFFVVMYSVSSVNEGKFRTVSASLNAAFRGLPRTSQPVQIGSASSSAKTSDMNSMADIATLGEELGSLEGGEGDMTGTSDMMGIADEIGIALASLIRQGVVVVRHNPFGLEVEIQTDILFASAVARPSTAARKVISQLAVVLKRYPNPLRVEGHTDNLPISNATFASNWELSAARAASVVRLIAQEGVDPKRMAVTGFGEHRPIASNATVDGRNKNRRVLMVILSKAKSLAGSKSVNVQSSSLENMQSLEAEPVAPVSIGTE
ncbi:MAG: flagellar motor protein MotD [Spongiibacteraceae bacterium]